MHADFHASYTIPGFFGFAIQVFLVGIIFGYLLIAWQFWNASKPIAARPMARVDAELLEERARTAFKQLMLIFILCSMSGYIPRLVKVPDWAFVFLHGSLFFATWWYVLSRQAVVIAEAMARHDRV